MATNIRDYRTLAKITKVQEVSYYPAALLVTISNDDYEFDGAIRKSEFHKNDLRVGDFVVLYVKEMKPSNYITAGQKNQQRYEMPRATINNRIPYTRAAALKKEEPDIPF